MVLFGFSAAIPIVRVVKNAMSILHYCITDRYFCITNQVWRILKHITVEPPLGHTCRERFQIMAYGRLWVAGKHTQNTL